MILCCMLNGKLGVVKVCEGKLKFKNFLQSAITVPE